MKVNADTSRSAAPKYTIGQQVWLSTENLCLTCASRKLSERWLGLYTIIGLAGPNAIELKLPRSMQIHPVVNVLQVKLYRDRLEGQPSHRLGPIHVTEDRDNEWEVDRIIDSCYKNKTLEFLVHWRAMMTQIVPGNLKVTSATQRKHCLTFTTLTPRHPGPFQSLQRISYYFSKRGQSLLQVFTPSKSLLIAWKSIFREGVVLRLSTPNIVSMDLVVFPFFLYLI